MYGLLGKRAWTKYSELPFSHVYNSVSWTGEQTFHFFLSLFSLSLTHSLFSIDASRLNHVVCPGLCKVEGSLSKSRKRAIFMCHLYDPQEACFLLLCSSAVFLKITAFCRQKDVRCWLSCEWCGEILLLALLLSFLAKFSHSCTPSTSPFLLH